MMRARHGSPLALLALLALACGTPRTEVLIVIDTDMDVPAELNYVRVDLVGPNGETRSTEGSITVPADLPRTVGVVDETHSGRTVRVTVTGLWMDANVVQRRAVFTFVPHETRILRIDLLRSCVGMGCPSDETCAQGGCRAVEIDPAELLPYDPTLVRRLDAGPEQTDGGVDGGCVPMKELCNGIDDDCDSEIDNGFDFASDVENCGGCGNACPTDPDNAASLCAEGSCALRCDVGFEDCNGQVGDGCEAVLSKPAHCGDCGTSCTGATPFCQESDAGHECVATCDAGTTDCMGACVNITSDPLRCGACDNRCTAPANAVATCAAGTCTFECDPGYADCDGDPGNGCESMLRELDNCGRCGMRCERAGGVTSCATGSCQLVGCQPLFGDCDGDPDNGCEESLATLTRCGSCTNACPTGVTQGSVACVDGSCRLSCNDGFGDCDATIATGCEQSLSTMGACGMCGVSCADPTPLCEAVGGGHACTDGCTSGSICAMSCVDTSTDPLHCGGCGRACPAGANAVASCTGGTCALDCLAGWGDCDMDTATGCETSIRTDVSSCGACGDACPVRPNATASCSDASCGVSCNTGFEDCNGMAGDGCEAAIESEVLHCGRCGNACTLRSGATAVECSGGVCGITACGPGLADCDGSYANGCEIDTQVSRNHCGTCGNACGPGRVCCGGMCRRNSEC